MKKFIAAVAIVLGFSSTPALAQDDFLATLFGQPSRTAPHDAALARIQSQYDQQRETRAERQRARTEARRLRQKGRQTVQAAEGYIAERDATNELATLDNETSASPHAYAAYGGGSVGSMATRIALANGVSPALVHAVIKVESGGRCHVTGGGAKGAMQVKPATARGVGIHGNLHDCATGITAGVRYLKQALALNRGNICAAATGYNAGLGVRGRCSGYGRKVMAAMGRYQRVASIQ
jgi:soluble lytic murein transglycosylase-like protein